MSESSAGASPPAGDGEKEELIRRILELQNTLHDLSQRASSVKEENAKLKAENQVRVYFHHGIHRQVNQVVP